VITAHRSWSLPAIPKHVIHSINPKQEFTTMCNRSVNAHSEFKVTPSSPSLRVTTLFYSPICHHPVFNIRYALSCSTSFPKKSIIQFLYYCLARSLESLCIWKWRNKLWNCLELEWRTKPLTILFISRLHLIHSFTQRCECEHLV
jgi:hypothetical protein